MIESVEGFGFELKIETLVDFKILGHAHVELDGIKSAEVIARNIAVDRVSAGIESSGEGVDVDAAAAWWIVSLALIGAGGSIDLLAGYEAGLVVEFSQRVCIGDLRADHVDG